MNVQSGPSKVSYFAPIVLDFQVSHHLQLHTELESKQQSKSTYGLFEGVIHKMSISTVGQENLNF